MMVATRGTSCVFFLHVGVVQRHSENKTYSEPTASRHRSDGASSTSGRPRIGPGSTSGGDMSTPDRPDINHKSMPDRAQDEPGSHIGHKSTQNRPRIDHRATPDRLWIGCENDPGSRRPHREPLIRNFVAAARAWVAVYRAYSVLRHDRRRSVERDRCRSRPCAHQPATVTLTRVFQPFVNNSQRDRADRVGNREIGSTAKTGAGKNKQTSSESEH